MKSRFLSTFVALIMMGLILSAPAAANDMWTKLGRGCSDIIFCTFEIPYQMSQMAKNERWPIAIFGGGAKGVFAGAWRLLVGVYEVISFPISWPHGYEPLLNPEFLLHSSEFGSG